MVSLFSSISRFPFGGDFAPEFDGHNDADGLAVFVQYVLDSDPCSHFASTMNSASRQRILPRQFQHCLAHLAQRRRVAARLQGGVD